MKSVTAALGLLDMRSGCHAAKILPVGVRGTKNVRCLSSLFSFCILGQCSGKSSLKRKKLSYSNLVALKTRLVKSENASPPDDFRRS